jgi:hypothetical protein
MAIQGTNIVTLADLAKRYDKDGKIDKIVEMLNETNEVLDDMAVVEGNLPTGHRTTIRSGLPSATWRKLNYGVQPSKSETVQITDNCGMLEAYAEIDKALAELNGNKAEFRLSEDRAFLESMNQTMATTLFYGDTTLNPERFMGLTPRFNDPAAENGSQLINGGGVSGQTDCTSIWLVVWGPNTIHGIIPKGSKTGWQHHDLGQQTLTDANGGYYEGYRTHYKWDMGMTVRDWRYIARIHSVDVSTLTKTGSTGADLVDLMTQAVETVKDTNMGRPVFYVNRTVRSYLRRQIRNANNVQISMDEVAGKKVLTFDGIPVRRTDALLATETSLN